MGVICTLTEGQGSWTGPKGKLCNLRKSL